MKTILQLLCMLILLTCVVLPITAIATPTLQAATLAQQKDQPADGQRQISLNQESAAEIGSILLVFLVLSVIFEVALQPIFEWRIFQDYLEDKGFKTPIKLALAIAVFWSFKLDIFTDLLNAMTNRPLDVTFWGRAITALLIAGGSSGVHEVFKKLGIRQADTEPSTQKKEEINKQSQQK